MLADRFWRKNLSRAASCRRLACWLADADHRGEQVTSSSDDRSPLSKAYQWSTRIMVVAMEMVLPGLVGHWLDERLGTVVVLMLLGFALGGTAATVHLMHMVRAENESRSRKREK